MYPPLLLLFLFSPPLCILYILLTHRRTRHLAIIHPHPLAAGGGERVLLLYLSTLAQKYTILTQTQCTPTQLTQHAQARFGITLEAGWMEIHTTKMKSEEWKHATILMNVLEQILFAVEVILRRWDATMMVDTCGLPYTYIIFKAFDRSARWVQRKFGVSTISKLVIAAYVHYPVITHEMIRKNKENTRPDVLQHASTQKNEVETPITWKRTAKVQ